MALLLLDLLSKVSDSSDLEVEKNPLGFFEFRLVEDFYDVKSLLPRKPSWMSSGQWIAPATGKTLRHPLFGP